jgi:hypothetical protein
MGLITNFHRHWGIERQYRKGHSIVKIVNEKGEASHFLWVNRIGIDAGQANPHARRITFREFTPGSEIVP